MSFHLLEIESGDSLLLLFALILLLPIMVLFVECVAALFPHKKIKKNIDKTRYRPKVTVLVAAHNEEPVIGRTLAAISPQLTDRDKLVVVADNCNDRTAAIAKTFEAIVIERKNLNYQGKGYALDYGLRSIRHDPSDVVIILDADCQIQSNYIESLAYKVMISGRPVQPINLLYRADKTNLKSAISEFAFIVKNLVRPQGLNRLDLPCMVTMGTAFPWSAINQISLASDNLVEDMQFGIDLAIAGNPPLFCSDTKVTGVLPAKDRAATTQRTRWEQGHLSTLRTQVPRLVGEAWKQKRLDLLAIAFDLSVPPLSFLVILWSIVATAAMTTGMLRSEANLAIYGVAIEGIILFTAILLAWAKFGREIMPLKSLATIPLYIFWKIPIYCQFLINPEQKWIRTERDSVSANTEGTPVAELAYKK